MNDVIPYGILSSTTSRYVMGMKLPRYLLGTSLHMYVHVALW